MHYKWKNVCFAFLSQSCYSDHKKASNLEAYVEWFNRLSYLVATEICMVSVRPRQLQTLIGLEWSRVLIVTM